MKRTFLLGSFATLALAAAAWSDPPSSADKNLRLATMRLEQGQRNVKIARNATTNAGRLEAWDKAIVFLREARNVSWTGKGDAFETIQKASYADLVRAYTAEAEIYLERKSLPIARYRTDQALELDPNDARARNLDVMITAAEHTDFYDQNQGAVAVERIRDRRAGIGLPVRDRGITRRF